MFKRGSVVQDEQHNIGVVLWDQCPACDYASLCWLTDDLNPEQIESRLEVELTPVADPERYAFEAALALGDTAKALDLYRAAQASLVQVEHERDALRDELDVTDKLYSETRRVVQAIPECSIHGECVPHALEWVEESKRIRREHKALFLSLPVPNTKAAAYQIFVEINGERYEFKDFSMLQKVDDTDASTADEGDPI